MRFLKIFWPIGFFIIFFFSLLLPRSFGMMSDAGMLLFIVFAGCLIMFAIEVIYAISKSASVYKIIIFSRKIGVYFIVGIGVLYFFIAVIKFIIFLVSVLNSPNKGFLPLFLPFLAPVILFGGVSTVLIILLIIKIKERVKTKTGINDKELNR